MKETFQIMRFIGMHRFAKKKKLYRLAFGVAFDWTIMIYSSVLGILLLLGVSFKLIEMKDTFYHYQELIEPFLPFVLVGLIIKMALMSFKQPGILFASAEWKLASLTYSIGKIWLYQFIKQLIKYVISISAVFLLIFFLTPMAYTFLLKWYLLILSFQLFLLLPQWYIYQLKGWKKLFVYIGIITFVGFFRVLFAFGNGSDWFIYILLFLLILFNGWIWPRKLKHSNWSAVIEQNDLKLWNMFFINKMSKMEIKPARKQYFLQTLFTSKKARLPFSYHKPEVILRKIWRIHISNEWNIIIMMFITVIISIVALSMQGPVEQGVGIALSIFMLEKVTITLFGVIFQDKLIYSIPWNMETMRKAFGYWAKWMSSIVVLIIFIALLVTKVFHLLLVMVFVVFVLFFLLQTKLQYKILQLNESHVSQTITSQIMTLLAYIALGLSIAYPITISFSIILFTYMFLKRRY